MKNAGQMASKDKQSPTIEDRRKGDVYQDLLEGAVEGIIVHKEGKTLYANPALVQLFGYGSVEEVLELESVYHLYVEEERNRLIEIGKARLRGENPPTQFEAEGLRKNGEKVWVHLTSRISEWAGEPVVISGILDISDKKRGEQALLESERKYRTWMEHAPSGIFITNANGQIVEVSQRAAEITGEEMLSLTGRDLSDFFDEKGQELLRGLMEMPEGGKASGEFQIIRKNNQFLFGRFSGSRMEDGRLQIVLLDITANHLADEKLRQSEAKFRHLVEGSLQGILVVNRERVQFANTALANMLGLDNPDDFVGKPLLELFPPHEHSSILDGLAACDSGHTPAKSQTHQMSHPHRKVVETNALMSLVEWEGEAATLISITDITEQMQAERELVRLAQAVEQAGDLIFITDINGVIEYINPAFERITGYTRKEVINQTPRILKSGEKSIDFYKSMWATIKSGQIWRGRYTNQRKDGTIYEVDAVHSPVRNQDGSITNIIAVHHDVTERINLENQLRQAQKMEAIGQLAGGIAHEFNNLLQVIKGYSELVMRKVGEDEKQIRNLNNIRDAVDKASLLTGHLLTFTRRQTPNLRKIDLNKQIENMVSIIGPLLGERIKVELSLTSDLPPVSGDALMIEQVLMNLCVNARDAMPEGGSLKLATTVIQTTGAFLEKYPRLTESSYIRMTVCDSGTGMPKDVMSSIFDPFYTTKEPGKGTGLGLSTAYGIMEQHDGMIEVESLEDEGTSFICYFPIGLELLTPQIIAGQDNPTVLVAEDDISVRELMAQVLREEGYQVLLASDGEGAIKMFDQYHGRIHAVVCDVLMPKVNGPQVYSVVKHKFPDTRFIFSSGQGSTINDILEEPDHRVMMLRKPFRPLDLLQVVKGALKIEEAT